MAHKTLVNGTSYDITGGKTLVSGTAYSIAGGKTLVGGTGYDISFKPPELVLFNGGTGGDYSNFTFHYIMGINGGTSYVSNNTTYSYIKNNVINFVSQSLTNEYGITTTYESMAYIGPIDSTNYSTLHILAYRTSAYYSSLLRFGYYDSTSCNASFSKFLEIDPTVSNASEYTCDILSASGEQYVKFYLRALSYSAACVTKVWLT